MIKTISRYRIVEKPGSGGIASSIGRKTLSLAPPFALKFLLEDAAHEPHALERLRREARAACARSRSAATVIGFHCRGVLGALCLSTGLPKNH